MIFVTRHPGAREWARRQALSVDCYTSHLDLRSIEPGDIVLGTLPVHLAAAVCERRARYLHLVLELPESARGRELSCEELERFGARLCGFRITPETDGEGWQT